MLSRKHIIERNKIGKNGKKKQQQVTLYNALNNCNCRLLDMTCIKRFYRFRA